MTDHEKLRAQVWAQCASLEAVRMSVSEAALNADRLLHEFDKRFPSAECAHIFYSPSRHCAKCGAHMPSYIETDAYGVESVGKL